MSRRNIHKIIPVLYVSLLILVSCNTVPPPVTTDGKHYITIDSTIGLSELTESIIKPYRDSIEKEMNLVIGYSDLDMNKGRPESLLTNFVADILLSKGIEIAQERNCPSPILSIINVKGLRSPIKKGSITVSSIFRVMPFENKLVILTLSGQQIKTLFEHMADMGGEGLSGASFGIKDDKPVNIKINGKPLNSKKTYTIVTADYLANGGDNYSLLPTIEERYPTEIKIRDVIISSIKNLTKDGKQINSTPDKRIYYVN